MADEIRRVDYFYVQVPDQPGEAARALATLREGGVNLLCFSGFPEGRRAQLDFVPEDPTKFREAARKARWKVTGPKKALTATHALCAGAGRYGVLLWVPPRDVARAARVLGAA